MSIDDLINLGLLPPAWPNHRKEWNPEPKRSPRMEFPANRNMTEREVYTNALLTLSLGEGTLEELGETEPIETDKEAIDLYNSWMAILDLIFDTDTDVTLIPGFKEGRLPRRIVSICTKYASVFKKSHTANKRTNFETATLPLID